MLDGLLTPSGATFLGVMAFAALWGTIGARLAINSIRDKRDVYRRDLWLVLLAAVFMPAVLIVVGCQWLARGDEVVWPKFNESED